MVYARNKIEHRVDVDKIFMNIRQGHTRQASGAGFHPRRVVRVELRERVRRICAGKLRRSRRRHCQLQARHPW